MLKNFLVSNIPDLSPGDAANFSVKRVWPAGGSLHSLTDGVTSDYNLPPFLHGTDLDAFHKAFVDVTVEEKPAQMPVLLFTVFSTNGALL